MGNYRTIWISGFSNIDEIRQKLGSKYGIDVEEFLKMFEAGIPLGDIFWKIQGIVIEPDPETGYDHMFSSLISQLGIPEEILKEKRLLGP